MAAPLIYNNNLGKPKDPGSKPVRYAKYPKYRYCNLTKQISFFFKEMFIIFRYRI